jgi:hypothetical protein
LALSSKAVKIGSATSSLISFMTPSFHISLPIDCHQVPLMSLTHHPNLYRPPADPHAYRVSLPFLTHLGFSPCWHLGARHDSLVYVSGHIFLSTANGYHLHCVSDRVLSCLLQVAKRYIMLRWGVMLVMTGNIFKQ